MKNLLIIFVLLVSFSSQSQEYENLIFEGGGIRGIAYAGVIEQLDSLGILKNIKRVGGTSAGAMAATAVALNYSSMEITEMMYDLNLKKFNDSGLPLIGGWLRVFNKYGYYKGDKMHSWIGTIIKEQTGDENITFFDMKKRGFKDLYVTGTSMNQQETIIFSYETFPDMKVKDAVLISMTVPLYFKPVIIDTTGKIITKDHLSSMDSNAYHFMVDGGIAANLPIELFDRESYTDTCIQAFERCVNPYTLAVRLDTDKQIELDRQGKNKLAYEDINGFTDFISAFYTYSIEKLNRPKLIDEDWERTILVSSGDIKPRIKNLKEEEKRTLIENGRRGVRIYFDE